MTKSQKSPNHPRRRGETPKRTRGRVSGRGSLFIGIRDRGRGRGQCVEHSTKIACRHIPTRTTQIIRPNTRATHSIVPKQVFPTTLQLDSDWTLQTCSQDDKAGGFISSLLPWRQRNQHQKEGFTLTLLPWRHRCANVQKPILHFPMGFSHFGPPPCGTPHQGPKSFQEGRF